jgi:hypothetical protein
MDPEAGISRLACPPGTEEWGRGPGMPDCRRGCPRPGSSTRGRSQEKGSGPGVSLHRAEARRPFHALHRHRGHGRRRPLRDDRARGGDHERRRSLRVPDRRDRRSPDQLLLSQADAPLPWRRRHRPVPQQDIRRRHRDGGGDEHDAPGELRRPGRGHAYAFGSHGAGLFPEHARGFWVHVLTSGVLVGLFLLNASGAALLRGSGPGRRASCGP